MPPERTTVSEPASRARRRRGGGDRLVEGGGDARRVAASLRRPARPGRASPNRHSYGAASSVARQLLELDRSLSLVGDLVAHAEDGRDRVEEPPHPGRERRVRLQALAHDLPARPRHRQPGLLEQCGRRPATARGSPPRRPVAGPGRARRGARTTRGRSAGAPRPTACRRCRSRCRRRRAPAPGRSRRARRGTRPRGRGGAAPRRAAGPARAPTSSRGTRDGGRRRPPRARRRACRGRARGRW